ncbi:globin domain-containing protein [Cytophagales bacterium LB-30]|uniref:Globin domain-containing protein n=1 Tax=Shiella aurantiaca TaxID=3058365 RepID=A0ABT8F2W7_9BACT|nr:globin domain-containing protein [Shiella aurantiaca]MDN4164788.1 globin domain-containing protein [Shiella aurantiaca]
MHQKEIKLIEDSWDYILANTQEAGLVFYNDLFEKNPELRALFTTDLNDQARKLVALITFSVNKLNEFDSLVSDIELLGLRHHAYGVKPEFYEMVRQSLMFMLEQGMGENWNTDLAETWGKLYKHLSEVMINASYNHLAIKRTN